MPARSDSSDRTGDARLYTAEDGRTKWAEIMGSVRYGGDHAVITYSGKPAAVVVPIDWYLAQPGHRDIPAPKKRA